MERHVCSLLGALGGSGHAVKLVTTSNSLGPPLRNELQCGGVELIELGRSRGSAGGLQKAIWLAFTSLRLKASGWDVVYTNGQSGLARFVWSAGCRTTRIVHHHHTSADPEEQSTWSGTYRKVLSEAPELVGCSEFTCAAIRQATGREGVVFLPYLTQSPMGADDVAEIGRKDGGMLNFGFVGRLVREKGVETIMRLSALPSLSGITWHIHGQGEDYPASSFVGRERVVYHGPFSGPREHAEVLRGLDAVVLFSHHNEGMPLSLIEAMSAGLPWIATDRGGTREIAVEPDEALVVSPGLRFEELASEVFQFSERIRNGRTFRARQRNAYDRFFAPRAVTEKWMAFLLGASA